MDGEKIDEVIKYEKAAVAPKKAAEEEVEFEAAVDDLIEEPVVVKKAAPVAKPAVAPKSAPKAAPVEAVQVEDEEDWMKMLNS